MKKDFSLEIGKLEGDLCNYLSEKDLEILKTEFPVNSKCRSKKLAYPYEHFNSIDDNQKHVNNLKEGDFFSISKTDCCSDEERERLKKR